jgi:ribosomal protein S27E
LRVPAPWPAPWKGGRMADADLLDITCPRCNQPAAVRFYGPCDGCRAELAATMGGRAREVDATYEPKANVVPNQVATKE